MPCHKGAVAHVPFFAVGEHANEFCAMLLEHLCVLGILREGMQFLRVALKIEELFVAVTGEPDVFVAGASNPLHAVIAEGSDHVLAVQVLAWGFSLRGAAKAHPAHGFGYLHSGEVQEGGHNVANLHHGIHLPACAPALSKGRGNRHNEGDVA